LKNSDKLIDVEAQNIYPEHMSVPGNKNTFTAMLYLKSKNIRPEPMAIMEVLSGDAKASVEELGGLDYLMTLQEAHVPEGNLPIFIEKIMQSYTRKAMHNIAESVRDFVLSEKSAVLNPSEIISFAEQRIADLGVNTQGDDDVYKMGDNTENVLALRAESPAKVPGLEVGMQTYDDLTNGAQPGDLIIVCAPSKTGKSVLLTNWANKLSIIDKLPVLYIDSEMTSREQEDRLLANLTGIPAKEIVSGMYVMDTENGLAVDKVARLKEAREKLKMGNYYHVYMPQFTIEKVTALVRKFQLQFGIVALFFDYIKIPSNQADFKSAQEYQKLGFFTSGLKDIAGLLQMPVFTACQANRSDVATEKPDESSIGGSYRILQLASKLMFLYNKSEERIAKDGGAQYGNQQLFIKWQRNGDSDCPPINIKFDKPILRMEEA
jgi:replicative DNA helicase